MAHTDLPGGTPIKTSRGAAKSIPTALELSVHLRRLATTGHQRRSRTADPCASLGGDGEDAHVGHLLWHAQHWQLCLQATA